MRFPLVLQVFYRARVIGAVIFTVFGVVHLSNVWELHAPEEIMWLS